MESNWDEGIVLDLKHFRDFTAGDANLEREVLKMFLDNVPDYIRGLMDVPNSAWAIQSHKVKGAARAIGAWNLAIQAERLEFLEVIPAVGSKERRYFVIDLEDRIAAVRDQIEALGFA